MKIGRRIGSLKHFWRRPAGPARRGWKQQARAAPAWADSSDERCLSRPLFRQAVASRLARAGAHWGHGGGASGHGTGVGTQAVEKAV